MHCPCYVSILPLSTVEKRKKVLRALSSGAVLVSGGRPSLSLWVSEDGGAKQWKSLDIPTEHNKLVTDPALKFCPHVVQQADGPGRALPKPKKQCQQHSLR